MSMSYEQFKNELSSYALQSQESWFHYVTTHPFFAIIFSLAIVCFFLSILPSMISEETASHNKIIYSLWKDNSEDGIRMFFVGSAIVCGVVTILTLVVLSLVYADKPDYVEADVEKTYIKYMEQQENITLNISEVLLNDKDIRNVSSSDKNYIQSNIFNNIECANCIKSDILFKQNKDDDKYISATVLISYSLESGERPYIVTKPPLRETVYNLKQSSYYNPVLYVEKSLGGIK